MTVSLSLRTSLPHDPSRKTEKPRKDAAVHVSLSSDEIVKQPSEEKAAKLKTPGSAQSRPNASAPDKTEPTQSPDPALPRQPRVARPETSQANVPSAARKQKRADIFPPLSSARESAEAIDHGHNQPTRQLAIAVGARI